MSSRARKWTLVLAALLASTIPTCAGDPGPEEATTTAPPHKDLMKLFFHDLNEYTNLVCRPILTSDFMLGVALVMCLQWHFRHFFQNNSLVECINRKFGLPTRLVRKLGMNIWILQIYYDPSMPDVIKSRRFVVSCWLIFLDNVVIYFFFDWLSGNSKKAADTAHEEYIQLNTGGMEIVSRGDPRWEDEEEGDGDEDDPVTSKYTDLTYPIRRLVPMFIIQGALLLLYVDNLNSDKDSKDANNVKFSYWIIGVLLQLYAGDRQLGDAYNKKSWDALDKHEDVRDATHDAFVVFSMTYGTEWNARNFMDFVINSVCRLIILFTFPIMLSVEGPLDFVKDCTAVFFMTTLDDLEPDDYKTIPQMMVHLKFNLLYERILHHPEDCRNGLPDIPVKLNESEARIATAVKKGDTDRFTRQRAFRLKIGDDEFALLKHLINNAEPQAGTTTGVTTRAMDTQP